jgi:hypothetical protein
MPSSHPRFLRREANPFPWKDLTRQQQSAVETIAGLLLEALKRNERRKEDASTALDFDRHSQLVFIDGDRGMGKTSVLLSVRGLLGHRELAGLPKGPVRRLHEDRKKFVLLETLDMEPLAPTANLLAAILVRISSRLDYPGKPIPPRLALALDELDGREKLASELHQLELDAVLAWAGTEKQRARYADPTAYAAEVLASERAGLSLNPRLAKVLDGLAHNVFADEGNGPIFVLPVDDFDLAPARCLELLRIIRMVSSPRLVFLIAGNTRLAESVLRLQGEGELAALAPAFASSREADWVWGAAVEIAANNLRKLVPPQQRARLEIVSVTEARGMRVSLDAPTLNEALTSVIFERNNAPSDRNSVTLESFLFPESATSYLASGWLAGTPRQVLDRAAMLDELNGEHTGDWGESLLRRINEDIQRELLEYGHIDPDRRERILQVLDVRQGLQFDFRGTFSVDSEIGRVQTVKSETVTLRCRFPRGYQWLIREIVRNEETGQSPLHPRLAGPLTLLHDLAISLWGGYVPDSVVYSSSRLREPVTVEWFESGADQSIRWQLPEWWTLREFIRFFAHWEAHSNRCATVDDHVRAWLAAWLEVILEQPNEPTEKGRSFKRLRDNLSQLAAERPTRAARRYLRMTAFVAATLLLSPESGGSASLAEDLLSRTESFFGALDDEMERRVREQRAAAFAVVKQSERRLDHAVVRLLSAISPDEAVRTVWNSLILKLPSTSPADKDLSIVKSGPDADGFEQALRRIQPKLGAHNSDLDQDLDLMLFALTRPSSNHPINRFVGLTPTSEEIDRVQPQRSRRR